MKHLKEAFTLVELIVVITILTILATIGFVSFSGYLAGTRDTNRIAQVKAMSDALALHSTTRLLPLPDDRVEIRAGTTTIAYQGYIGKKVLESIKYTDAGLDPKDKTYFSYYLTKNQKNFQLLTFLEEENTNVVDYHSNILSKLHTTDYSKRYPKVTGKKLGILTGTGLDLHTPIQELITSEIDIEATTIEYVANISDNSRITGTGGSLIALSYLVDSGGKLLESCKSILDDNNKYKKKDGVYLISPVGIPPIQVYCDMTTDGGGWTQFTKREGGNYYVYNLGGLLSRFDDLMYQYKRSGSSDSHAFKFNKFYTKQCGSEYGSLDNHSIGLREYTDHILTGAWGSCPRNSTPEDTNNIAIEEVIEGSFVKDDCLTGTLHKQDARNYAWGPLTSTNNVSGGWHQHRISNTTVLFGNTGYGSGRCGGSSSGPSASDIAIFVK